MSGNIFGKLLTLTTYGESHGKSLGGILDGFPAGIKIDYDFVKQELKRRRPGQSSLVSSRKESDNVEFLSGIENNISTGTPIAFTIVNTDIKENDYSDIRQGYRPSHADYTWESKYGIVSSSGGGRSSARETVARVVAGALAKLLLSELGISVQGFVNQIGHIKLNDNYSEYDLNQTESSLVRCPDETFSNQMIESIEIAHKDGDSLGGMITCVIHNVPAGIGEPVFNKLSAELGHAILGINAVKAFEIGSGIKAASMKGTEHNDSFYLKDGNIKTRTNHSGGIQGGISNGEDIYFRATFKPVATIMKKQETVSRTGEKMVLEPKGRHDVCVVPRAVPIVEAMAALVIADQILINKTSRIDNIK